MSEETERLIKLADHLEKRRDVVGMQLLSDALDAINKTKQNILDAFKAIEELGS
jgi:hypothetical protein